MFNMYIFDLNHYRFVAANMDKERQLLLSITVATDFESEGRGRKITGISDFIAVQIGAPLTVKNVKNKISCYKKNTWT